MRKRITEGKCSRIDIEPSDNGGFVVRKHYHHEYNGSGPSNYREPETLTFNKKDELLDFLRGGLPAPKRRNMK